MKIKTVISSPILMLIKADKSIEPGKLEIGKLEDSTGFYLEPIGKQDLNFSWNYAIIPVGSRYYECAGEFVVSEQVIVFPEYPSSYPDLVLPNIVASDPQTLILRQGNDLEYLNKKIKYNGAYYKFGEEIQGKFKVEPNLNRRTKLGNRERFVNVRGKIEPGLIIRSVTVCA